MIELRTFAHALVTATTLEGKCTALPPGWSDAHPGEALRIEAPGRPADLQPVAGRSVRVPPLAGMPDPAQRRRILHALANHELQAAELFAWALLAWPQMPRAFRVGCAKILGDEQRHMRLLLGRLEALGGHFGEEPVSAHFWSKVPAFGTPLDFICTMGLTLEGANLDFSLEHAEAARAAGDAETADVLTIVHDDEIEHVRFAWVWLQKLAPDDPDRWATYACHVQLPGGPARARGTTFDAAGRRAAGLDEDFIGRLAATPPRTPGGAQRQ